MAHGDRPAAHRGAAMLLVDAALWRGVRGRGGRARRSNCERRAEATDRNVCARRAGLRRVAGATAPCGFRGSGTGLHGKASEVTIKRWVFLLCFLSVMRNILR